MHEALSDLYSLTTDRQQSDSLLATFAQRDDFPGIPDDVWDDVVKYLHDHGGYSPEMLSADEVLSLISATHSSLMKGVSRGLTHEVSPELTSALEENTFIFSGFKTHAELKEASLLLRGEDGGLKSFEQFKRDVQSINETYNVQYLRAEYSFAEASAHVAMKWKDWEKGGRNYMLQYRTANDDRVRDSHRLLHNTTLPMDDPFWNSYIPPLGWRCRCNVVRVPADEYEQSNSELAQSIGEAATDLPKQRIFRFNPGKTLKVFPPKHPYMPKGCGDCDKRRGFAKGNTTCVACDILNRLKEQKVVQSNNTDARNAIESYPAEKWERTHISADNKGLLVTERTRIEESKASSNASSVFDKEQRMCKVIADNGHIVEHLAENNRAVGNRYDVHIDGHKADLKCIGADSNAGNMASYASDALKKQGANIVVFEIPRHEQQFYDAIHECLRKYPIRVMFYFSDERILKEAKKK